LARLTVCRAIAMLRAMEMKHWLSEAEAELSRAIA
jgi:hypothetical protein